MITKKVEKLTHLEHIEDQAVNFGIDGIRQAILFLIAAKNFFSGKPSQGTIVSLKIDGAPSIITGINPENGKFFVATKSFFSKDVKAYYTDSDIENAELPAGLASKLKIALKEFPSLNIQGILQGDYLFDRSDLRTKTIAGDSHIIFRPNTITYAVAEDSDVGAAIKAANIGVAFHTQYLGKSLSTLVASLGFDARTLTKTPRVFVMNARVKDVSGALLLSKSEQQKLTENLRELNKLSKDIEASNIHELMMFPEIITIIKRFTNANIRNNVTNMPVNQFVNRLITFVNADLLKAVEKLKTEKHKAKTRDKFGNIITNIDKYRKTLEMLYTIQNKIVESKNIILAKTSDMGLMKSFIEEQNSLKVTAQEGLVIANNEGEAVKLVDRLEFSKQNFNLERNW